MRTELASPVLEISPIGIGDIDDLLALGQEAGWNQTEDDWVVMLRLGQGFGMRDRRGRTIASCVVLPYPPDFGWVGMVLVGGAHRRQGHATRLLRHGIEMLEGLGLVPILDASPAGRDVYSRLGFVPITGIDRWRGRATRRFTESDSLSAAEFHRVVAMDAKAFGASRPGLFAALAGRPEAVVLQDREDRGFLFSRPGSGATQIGPVLAETGEIATQLIARALDAIDGPVLLDVPAREVELGAMLAARGFAIERGFKRMALRPTRPFTIGRTMRVIAGPELG